MTATRGSSATAVTEARPRPVAAGRLRLNGGTMKLIPHHQDDKHGTREYRSPDGRLASPADPPPRRKPERAAALGGSRALRGPRRWLASSRRLRAPAGGTRWSSWTPRPQRRGARASRQRPPGGARPPNPRRNHPSPARAGRRRGRPRTTSTKPAPRTSRGRCAACSCTIRGRSRRRASRRPAGSASGSGRRPATGNAKQR